MHQIYTFDEKLADFYEHVQQIINIRSDIVHLEELKKHFEMFKQILAHSEFSEKDAYKQEIINFNDKINMFSQTKKNLEEYELLIDYTEIIRNSDKKIFDMMIQIPMDNKDNVKNFISKISDTFTIQTIEDSSETILFLKSSDYYKFYSLVVENEININMYTLSFKLPIPFEEQRTYITKEDFQGLDRKEDFINFAKNKDGIIYFPLDPDDLMNDFIYNIDKYNIDSINIPALRRTKTILLDNFSQQEQIIPNEIEKAKIIDFSNIINQIYIEMNTLNEKQKNNNISFEADHDTDDILSFLHDKNDRLNTENQIKSSKDELMEKYLNAIKNSPSNIYDILIEFSPLNSKNKNSPDSVNQLKQFLDCQNKNYRNTNDFIIIKSSDFIDYLNNPDINDHYKKHFVFKFIPPEPYKPSIESHYGSKINYLQNDFNKDYKFNLSSNIYYDSSRSIMQPNNYCNTVDFNSIVHNVILNFIDNIHKYDIKDHKQQQNNKQKPKL